MDTAVILLLVLLAVGLWFLIRELICWYYKINLNLKKQDQIIDLLTSMLEKMDVRSETEEVKSAEKVVKGRDDAKLNDLYARK